MSWLVASAQSAHDDADGAGYLAWQNQQEMAKLRQQITDQETPEQRTARQRAEKESYKQMHAAQLYRQENEILTCNKAQFSCDFSKPGFSGEDYSEAWRRYVEFCAQPHDPARTWMYANCPAVSATSRNESQKADVREIAQKVKH